MQSLRWCSKPTRVQLQLYFMLHYMPFKGKNLFHFVSIWAVCGFSSSYSAAPINRPKRKTNSDVFRFIALCGAVLCCSWKLQVFVHAQLAKETSKHLNLLNFQTRFFVYLKASISLANRRNYNGNLESRATRGKFPFNKYPFCFLHRNRQFERGANKTSNGRRRKRKQCQQICCPNDHLCLLIRINKPRSVKHKISLN